MTTTAYTATPDAWTKVADGLENVLITNEYVWPVQVHVGTADPAAGVAFHEATASEPFAMHGIAGQKVYVRSGHATRSMTVTVTAA